GIVRSTEIGIIVVTAVVVVLPGVRILLIRFLLLFLSRRLRGRLLRNLWRLRCLRGLASETDLIAREVDTSSCSDTQADLGGRPQRPAPPPPRRPPPAAARPAGPPLVLPPCPPVSRPRDRPVRPRGCLPPRLPACRPACLPASLPACLPVYLPAWLPACL